VEGDFRHRLARYHEDPDYAFWNWNDIWLNASFRDWNIHKETSRIRCPILAVQGEQDEYGTMAQIDEIAALTPATQLLKLKECGHSPHRDQPGRLIDAVSQFVRQH
jgi:pimeloyl-ACP methyl ester carboxylesterase